MKSEGMLDRAACSFGLRACARDPNSAQDGMLAFFLLRLKPFRA